MKDQPLPRTAQFSQRTASLVRDYQRGDDDAFRSLYELHCGPVLRSVARSLGRHLQSLVDPEDILQETFRLACAELEKRSHEDFQTVGLFRLLLVKIARQVVIDQGRRAASEKRNWRRGEGLGAGHNEVADDAPHPSEIARGQEAADLAEDALGSLSEGEREILDLRDNLELEYSEIAEVLGLSSPEAAKLRCTRARRRWEERTRVLLGLE